MIAFLPCLYCRHYNPDDVDKPSCTAFPDGIPALVFRGRVDHRKPYPGDHGIRFEPRREGAEEDYDRLFEPEEIHQERMRQAYEEYEREIRQQRAESNPGSSVSGRDGQFRSDADTIAGVKKYGNT